VDGSEGRKEGTTARVRQSAETINTRQKKILRFFLVQLGFWTPFVPSKGAGDVRGGQVKRGGRGERAEEKHAENRKWG